VQVFSSLEATGQEVKATEARLEELLLKYYSGSLVNYIIVICFIVNICCIFRILALERFPVCEITFILS